jgi:hypothetical protein
MWNWSTRMPIIRTWRRSSFLCAWFDRN